MTKDKIKSQKGQYEIPSSNSQTSDNRLPIKLRKYGIDGIQVRRGMRSCIYKLRVSETVTRYDVFEIKVSRSRIIKGKEVSAHERYPGMENFSVWAWCCWDLPSALRRFDELERKGRTE